MKQVLYSQQLATHKPLLQYSLLVLVLVLVLATRYSLVAFMPTTNFGCTVTYSLFGNDILLILLICWII